MGKPITIGIADFNVGRDNDTLVTYALGSCVGICLYDAEKKIGGLAHIMLPSSKEAPLDFSGVRIILSMPSFGGEVKESVPCPSFAACKRT